MSIGPAVVSVCAAESLLSYHKSTVIQVCCDRSINGSGDVYGICTYLYISLLDSFDKTVLQAEIFLSLIKVLIVSTLNRIRQRFARSDGIGSGVRTVVERKTGTVIAYSFNIDIYISRCYGSSNSLKSGNIVFPKADRKVCVTTVIYDIK